MKARQWIHQFQQFIANLIMEHFEDQAHILSRLPTEETERWHFKKLLYTENQLDICIIATSHHPIRVRDVSLEVYLTELE